MWILTSDVSGAEKRTGQGDMSTRFSIITERREERARRNDKDWRQWDRRALTMTAAALELKPGRVRQARRRLTAFNTIKPRLNTTSTTQTLYYSLTRLLCTYVYSHICIQIWFYYNTFYLILLNNTKSMLNMKLDRSNNSQNKKLMACI